MKWIKQFRHFFEDNSHDCFNTVSKEEQDQFQDF